MGGEVSFTRQKRSLNFGESEERESLLRLPFHCGLIMPTGLLALRVHTVQHYTSLGIRLSNL